MSGPYPYYIVSWRQGRIPCPVHERMIPCIRRLYDSGKVGGSTSYERQTTDPREAFRIWQKQRQWNPVVYVVQRPNAPRRQIQPHTLNASAGSAGAEEN